jgi:glutaredoxin
MAPPIIIYTTETCPECKVVKSYLRAKNIDFKEVLVNSTQIIDEVVGLTGQRRVPVIKTSSDFIVGFNLEKINALPSPSLAVSPNLA